MYTQFDKALVALIMAIIGAVNLFGFHFGLDEATVNAIIVGLTPFLVYLVPNLPKDQSTN